MSGLILGGVTLEGFEIPGGLRFGGKQALAVHKLPGGTRVVDAMGPDDADLAWSGVLSGSAAADRARTLDLMRISGQVVPLAWDAFYYSVVIRRLDMSYANPWWIPYVIACTVVIDSAQLLLAPAITDANAILGDLGLAGELTNVSGALGAVMQSGALIPGSAAYASAGGALQSTSAGINAQIAQAELVLAGGDLSSVVSAAGSLASLIAAQGYLGRAITNFANASE